MSAKNGLEESQFYFVKYEQLMQYRCDFNALELGNLCLFFEDENSYDQ